LQWSVTASQYQPAPEQNYRDKEEAENRRRDLKEHGKDGFAFKKAFCPVMPVSLLFSFPVGF